MVRINNCKSDCCETAPLPAKPKILKSIMKNKLISQPVKNTGLISYLKSFFPFFKRNQEFPSYQITDSAIYSNGNTLHYQALGRGPKKNVSFRMPKKERNKREMNNKKEVNNKRAINSKRGMNKKRGMNNKRGINNKREINNKRQIKTKSKREIKNKTRRTRTCCRRRTNFDKEDSIERKNKYKRGWIKETIPPSDSGSDSEES